MDMFIFRFGKLKYVYYTIDIRLSMGNCLEFGKHNLVIIHLLEIMAIMAIPVPIKTDNVPSYDFNKIKQQLF